MTMIIMIVAMIMIIENLNNDVLDFNIGDNNDSHEINGINGDIF